MKKLYSPLLFFVFALFPAFILHAQKEPRIAITSFVVDSTDQNAIEDADAMRRIVYADFSVNGQGTLIFNGETDRIVKEKSVNLKEIYLPRNTSKFQESNVKYIITGYVNFYPEEKRYRLRLCFIDTETADFLVDETAQMESDGKNLSSKTKKLADIFISKINSGKYLNFAETPAYAIGDTGPAGGLIFFIKPNSQGGWRYLESAPRGIEFKAPWGYYKDGYYGPDGNDTKAELGSGLENTKLLSSLFWGDHEIGSAAVFCGLLEYNNFHDWYLPSKDELHLLWENLAQKGLGDFSSDAYWSSTQSTNNDVWFETLNDGKQYFNGKKTDILYVRAIRQF
jgi:hypothetical protein